MTIFQNCNVLKLLNRSTDHLQNLRNVSIKLIIQFCIQNADHASPCNDTIALQICNCRSLQRLNDSSLDINGIDITTLVDILNTSNHQTTRSIDDIEHITLVDTAVLRSNLISTTKNINILHDLLIDCLHHCNSSLRNTIIVVQHIGVITHRTVQLFQILNRIQLSTQCLLQSRKNTDRDDRTLREDLTNDVGHQDTGTRTSAATSGTDNEDNISSEYILIRCIIQNIHDAGLQHFLCSCTFLTGTLCIADHKVRHILRQRLQITLRRIDCQYRHIQLLHCKRGNLTTTVTDTND